jgi:hypothetical protein
VITVIELLSPANKAAGPDHEQYLAKRGEILGSMTHLVEVDLRRGGLRPPLENLPSCDYCVMVSRYAERPTVGFWPIGLRDPLPKIPIPLADPGELVPLDLQEALHRAYDAAHYGKYIYHDLPQPPLSAEDTAWARQFVPLPNRWDRTQAKRLSTSGRACRLAAHQANGNQPAQGNAGQS